MNPITSQNSFMNLLNAVRFGQLDAKAEVLSRLNAMTPEQKAQVKGYLPLLKKYASKMGFTEEAVDREIGAHL